VGRQTPVTARDSQDLGDYRERGLGVFLISQLADYHYYDQARPAGTELVVKKRIG
jgi:anti-sigma regulatory factor (Ser/Thr protein kinase)